MTQTIWISPLTICDTCGTDFDGFNCRLGTGHGQKYELQDLGDHHAWVKVAG